MNPFAHQFRACALQAGSSLGHPGGKVIRGFQLGDFLDNGIGENDSTENIAVKAIIHFCENEGWGTECFNFGVLVACKFLGETSVKGWTSQVVRDLGVILRELDQAGGRWDTAKIRRWVASNF